MANTTTKFAGYLVLWLLFTTVVALTDSDEHGKQGTGKDVTKHQDNVADGVPTTAALSKKGLQGRKMLVNDVMKNEQLAVKKEDGLSRDGSSLKSGAGNVESASLKSFGASSHDDMNDQAKGSMEKGSEPAAVDEFMSLMQKDYKGLKPRRKPPINNNHPLDDYHGPRTPKSNYEPLMREYTGPRTPKSNYEPMRDYHGPRNPVNNYEGMDDYHGPRSPTNNDEPMDDYHTPRSRPPSPTTNKPINDNGKGKHRRPPINNHEPLNDGNTDNVDGDAKP